MNPIGLVTQGTMFVSNVMPFAATNGILATLLTTLVASAWGIVASALRAHQAQRSIPSPDPVGLLRQKARPGKVIPLRSRLGVAG